MIEKIPFNGSDKLVYDLDVSMLDEETRSAIQACVQSQKDVVGDDISSFPASDAAMTETSEARLLQILETGEDIHGIASDRSISNVISFGSQKVTDTVFDDRIKADRCRVDKLMGRLLKSVFLSKGPLKISSSGHFWYPPGSYMGWHTNSRVPGWRVYINYAEEPGKSFFRYRDPSTKEIVTLNDNVWNIRIFRITGEQPIWHAVYSDTNRFSFGYMVHQQPPANRLSGLFRKLLKRLSRQLAERNYFLAKLLWKRNLMRTLQASGGEPIIDYQMGKVGSSTVRASLDAIGFDQPIYHVHFLNPVRVAEIEQQRRGYFRTQKVAMLHRPWTYQFLFKQIQKKDRHWKVVTLVREPIARNISTFFENLEVTEKMDGSGYAIKSDYYAFDIEVTLDDLEPLIALFFDRLHHDRPLRYFDDEVKIVFDLDIYNGDFPREKGYRIYQGDNADLLLVRLENLNQCAQSAFKDFMDIDGFSLVQTNVASEKVYALLYSEFKRTIRLPDSYINKMYDSKYTRYFFSDEEIQAFRNKWAGQRNA